jgi:hypothetical protein
MAKKLAFLNRNTANLYKNWFTTLVFKTNANSAKIAEISDHNIGPRLSEQLNDASMVQRHATVDDGDVALYKLCHGMAGTKEDGVKESIL